MNMLSVLFAFGVINLLNTALGQQQSIFVAKYKDAIQKYIMTGHEDGWRHCDILSASPSDGGLPQISMTLDNICNLDIRLALKNTQCLLVTYDVSSRASLLALLEFGWKAINHVRLAFLLKLHSGITLDMANGTSNLPFLVAAELGHGTEQFLCPIVGQVKPRLEEIMCNVSYMDYKNKVLRMSLMGLPPDFVATRRGHIDGVNMRLIKMIAGRLNFTPEITISSSFMAAANQVKDTNNTFNYDCNDILLFSV